MGCATALTSLKLGFIEELPIESLLDLAPMTQLEFLDLRVRARTFEAVLFNEPKLCSRRSQLASRQLVLSSRSIFVSMNPVSLGFRVSARSQAGRQQRLLGTGADRVPDLQVRNGVSPN